MGRTLSDPSERHLVASVGSAYADHRSELLDRPGIPGSVRRRALSDLADGWLARLFENAGGTEAGAALVAVGGYGRRELSPGSDLDVVLLRPRELADGAAAKLAEQIWYPIWDSGVRLDHAVRTVAQARRVAADDVPALLGLLDLRLLAGDVALSEGLRSSVLSDWRALAGKRLPDVLDMAAQRGERAGEVAYALEPDLKESRGGLRDLTVLRAVAASWLADPPHAGLAGAHEILLDVRDALHAVTGRSSDRLALQEQDAVADRLGLLDADQLLLKVSGAGRVIAHALDIAQQDVERAALPKRGRSRFLAGPRRLSAVPSRAPLADGVVEQDGQAVLARSARPAEDGALVLRAAAASAQNGLRLSPHAVQRLALEAPAIVVPWPAPARDAFVSLLGSGAAMIPVWESLDQAGLVSRLIPGWERVRSRPQRNPLHRFTVDRHLVETAVRAALLSRRVERPDLLLVGALLHDIGKGWSGDHTEAGMVVMADLAPRLGFDDQDTATLVTLVQHHLLLPNTATRRDLDDPATVAAVAAAVGTAEVLDLLHALTEADALATGPATWSPWKAALISDLVARTHDALEGAAPAPPPRLTAAEEALLETGVLSVTSAATALGLQVTIAAPDRTGLLAVVAGVLSLHRLAVRGARAVSVGSGAVQVWSVVPEFGDPPDLAAVRGDIRRALEGRLDIADRLARRDASYPDRSWRTAPPARVDLVPGASDVATVLEIRAHDRSALLHCIASALAASACDVRAARVSTQGSEAVDVFYVVGSDGHPLSAAATREVIVTLRTALQ